MDSPATMPPAVAKSDPIFVADDQLLEPGTEPLTTAQMTAEQKDAISHRGRALRAMVPQLLEVLGLEAS